MADSITVSVIKADVGGYVGHSCTHPALLERAERELAPARDEGLLVDFHVTRCGDDVQLIMTHRRGEDAAEIHTLAWKAFEAATEVARQLKLYGAGQDLLSNAFAGNVKGMGPGSAEMEMEERASETLVVFMADKTSAGAWNLPLYRMFADPFNTAGLVIAPSLHQGFRFEVHDILGHRGIFFDCPEELYDLLMFIGSPGRFTVKRVFSRATGEVAAVTSTDRLSQIAGQYVGKDDPVCIVRCQSQFPAVGEVLEPFAFPHLVEGWTRGSHHGPLVPCRVEQSSPTRYDGPPRCVALGFQLAEGRLVGPRELFDDPVFEKAREQAMEAAEYMRRHGPFEPHRVPLEEMEYTTLPQLQEKLAGRWSPLEDGRQPETAVAGAGQGRLGAEEVD